MMSHCHMCRTFDLSTPHGYVLITPTPHHWNKNIFLLLERIQNSPFPMNRVIGRHPCKTLETACVVNPPPLFITLNVFLYMHRRSFIPILVMPPLSSWKPIFSPATCVRSRRYALSLNGVRRYLPRTLSSLALINLSCESLGGVDLISGSKSQFLPFAPMGAETLLRSPKKYTM